MRKNLKPNIEYAEIFWTYWSVYCVIASFSSVFLLANGYTNTEIGTMIAVGNLVSVAIQPVLASVADRSMRFGVFPVSVLVTVVVMLFEAVTLILSGRNFLLSAAYVLMFAFQASLQPLLNSMEAKLARRGIDVDYGICRAMGSLGYSVMSALLGVLVVSAGVRALPVAGESCLMLLLGGLLLLGGRFRKAGSTSSVDSPDTKEKGSISMGEFIRRHRVFLVINIGILLIFYDHQIINFFMLQIFQNVGGDSGNMGHYYSIMTILELIPLLGFTWLTKRFRSSFLLKVATIGFVLRGILMLLAHTPTAMMLTLVVHPFGFPLFLPAVVRYINEIMDEREAVRGQSLYVIMITVSAVAASFSGGVILDTLGAGALLWICAVTCVIGAVIILPLLDRAKTDSAKTL